MIIERRDHVLIGFLILFLIASLSFFNKLKSINGPLPQVKFCPTGGISLATAPNYLALPNVVCVGGTWMLDKTLIANKDWTAIENLARQACELNR